MACLGHTGLVTSLAFSPDGKRLVRPAKTESSSSGTPGPVRRPSPSPGTRAPSAASRSAPTAGSSPRPATTGPS